MPPTVSSLQGTFSARSRPLGVAIERILRPSLIDSIRREFWQRLALAKRYRRVLQRPLSEEQLGQAINRLVEDLFAWYSAAVARHRLDKTEIERIERAIQFYLARSEL